MNRRNLSHWRLRLALVALTISACEPDSPTLPTGLPANASIARMTAAESEGLQVIERFTISLNATGSFRPGTPVQIRIDGTAHLPTPSAELRIVLPEVESAKRTSWDDGFKLETNIRLPAALEGRRAFNAGQRFSEDVTVTIPRPGYYHVVATVAATDNPPLRHAGRWIQNTAVAEGWLLVRDSGGRVTASFQTAEVPRGKVRASGPFREKLRRDPPSQPEQGSEERIHGPSPAPASSVHDATTATNDFITYRALYWNTDAGAYEPVVGSLFVIRGCTKEPEQIICEEADFDHIMATGAANENGYFSFPCEEDEYDGEVTTYATGVLVVVGGLAPASGDISDDCGQSFDTVLGSTGAHVFVNMRKAASGASALFGVSRPFIQVNISGSEENSFYDTGDDEITIITAHIWGSFGTFVAAHEYGHAFHEEALYGNQGAGHCPDQHFLDVNSNLRCAFSEGFADYFGAIVRPDLGNWFYLNFMEQNNSFPGCWLRDDDPPNNCIGGTSTEGSTIEGAYASFLYDLTDSAVEARDSVAAGGAYIRELIRTCQVNYGAGSRRAQGPDEIAYCAENAINPGSYFTVRGATPNSYSESATEGGGWTASRVNSNWKWNMYEKS